jgi:hypothetical protein
MSITIGKKQFQLKGLIAPAILAVLYFGQMNATIAGVPLPQYSVYFAFLWLMWTLNSIKVNGEKRIVALERKVEQLESR